MLASSSSSTPSGGVAGWAAGLMDSLGAFGAGVAVALENLFPPLPSEIILPLAGFAASQGRLDLLAVLLWTTAGSVVGALALYALGALVGRDRTAAWAARLPLVRVSDIERTEAWFARHGTRAVLLGRMIPIFRSMISLPAGAARMRLPVFLALTTVGSGVWNTSWVLAGYALGTRWHRVSDLVGTYSRIVLLAAALAVVVFVVLRLRRASRRPFPRRGGAHRRRP
ncbi:DedA family protein [Streptomyces sp. 4N509B]|uniref:DedA family protein n=1 Tax=Streptomyces sp. 4N509B TaxID=3457413 RepID=UPI003FD3D321